MRRTEGREGGWGGDSRELCICNGEGAGACVYGEEGWGAPRDWEKTTGRVSVQAGEVAVMLASSPIVFHVTIKTRAKGISHGT